MNKTLRRGKLFIVTTNQSTAGGWIGPGKHLLRVGEKRQQGKRHWNLWARCCLYMPLGSDEKGYPIHDEIGGYGIQNKEIIEIVPVEEYVVTNASRRNVHWCRITSAQAAELDKSWTLVKKYNRIAKEILDLP